LKIFFVAIENRVFLGSAASLNLLGHQTLYIYPICKKESQIGVSKPVTITIELFGRHSTEIKRLNLSLPSIMFLNNKRLKHISHRLECLNFKPDAFVTEGARTFYLSFMLSKLFKVPCILYIQSIRGLKFPAFVIHNAQYKEIIKTPLSIFSHIFQSYLADFCMASEPFTASVLERFNSRIKTLQPTYATFPTKKSRLTKILPNFPPYVLTILTVGRGIELTQLKIVLKIAKGLPKLKFIIVGTFKSDVEKIVLKYPDNVIFLGKIWDDNELRKLYQNAICVISPILLRAQSNRFFEALYYGKALITTSNCTFFYKGLISGKHIIIEDEFDKYIDHIRKIAYDRDFKVMLEHGAEDFFETTFSPIKHAKRLETLLFQIIHGSKQ
jgi:glycosyltransferase involved in cell wall biosynthesis